VKAQGIWISLLSLVFAPGFVHAQCQSEGPIEPCHCLTIDPAQPQPGDAVTVTLFINGEQMPLGPVEPDEFEPICFGWPEENELCLGDEDAVANDDGSITFEWTDEMQTAADQGGWAWVWWAENFFEDDGALAEVPLADLLENGVGCSSCSGDCDDPPGGVVGQVPAAGGLGLALMAGVLALAGGTVLRRRRGSASRSSVDESARRA